MLHILNGDAARMGFERSGIPGDVVVWPDVLYEGPTPLATGEAWIAVRARHLAALTDGGDEILEGYRRKDAVLEAFRDHDEVIFWFEHDLFDQLLLIRHLWWMKVRNALHASTRFSLVCHDTYLGPLKPEQYPPLFRKRQPITETQVDVGARVWATFCGEDPAQLVPFTTSVSPELPFLAAALRRFVEDYPSAANGLSRTEQQILRVASEGPLTMHRVFRASCDLDGDIFMGDLSFFNIVEALASAAHPLLEIEEDSGKPVSFNGTLRITATGRDVLAARADHIALNGVDRWLGGVHLTPTHLWRWDGSGLCRAPVSS